MPPRFPIQANNHGAAHSCHPPTLFMYLGMTLVIGGGLVAIRAKPNAPIALVDT